MLRWRPSELAAAAETAKKARNAELPKALPENPFGRNKATLKPATLVRIINISLLLTFNGLTC